MNISIDGLGLSGLDFGGFDFGGLDFDRSSTVRSVAHVKAPEVRREESGVQH